MLGNEANMMTATHAADEPTAMRMLTVRLVPRASYVPGAGEPVEPKGAVRLEVPYSMTAGELAAELVRETSAPTVTTRVRSLFGMNAYRNDEAMSARASAMQLYVEDCGGDAAALVPVPRLTRLEALTSIAETANPLSSPELTLYFAREGQFGDEAELCLMCCAMCACCAACFAASSAANAASAAKKPQPQSQNYAPSNPQGPYNYAGGNAYTNNNNGNNNLYMAQPQNNYGVPYNAVQPYPVQGMPPAQGHYVSGQPVPSAAGGTTPTPNYNYNNYNNYSNNNYPAAAGATSAIPTTSYGQYTGNSANLHESDGLGRTGSASPQEVVFAGRPPSPPVAAPTPAFSPAEGRDEFDYPTERPPVPSSSGSLPPPQYNLSGFKNESADFDPAKKEKTSK